MPTVDRELTARKKSIRAEVSTALAEMGYERLAEESSAIAGHLATLSEWSRSRTIFAFLSMVAEIDTTLLIESAFIAGKHVGVPRMYETGIRFHTIESLDDSQWDEHPYGVREPFADSPKADPADPAFRPLLVVTPGVAFDRSGGRLGHGRGYYDRFFAGAAGSIGIGLDGKDGQGPESIGEATAGVIVSVGICASCQIRDRVPVGPSDIPVDIVVSGRGVEYRRRRS